MSIEFYLQAQSAYEKDSEAVVREHFEFRGGSHLVAGHVEDSVIKQNPSEYKKFKDLVEAQKVELFAEARANLGAKVFPRKPVVSVLAPVADGDETDKTEKDGDNQ